MNKTQYKGYQIRVEPEINADRTHTGEYYYIIETIQDEEGIERDGGYRTAEFAEAAAKEWLDENPILNFVILVSHDLYGSLYVGRKDELVEGREAATVYTGAMYRATELQNKFVKKFGQPCYWTTTYKEYK